MAHVCYGMLNTKQKVMVLSWFYLYEGSHGMTKNDFVKNILKFSRGMHLDVILVDLGHRSKVRVTRVKFWLMLWHACFKTQSKNLGQGQLIFWYAFPPIVALQARPN